MGTPKPQKEVVAFHFQEIPLDEAVNAVIAGDGNYAVVKAKLLEALPNLPEGKAFAFGLPNGKEVEEDKRRGICMALNGTLKKAKLPWRVTYSGVKKLFVCVPPTTPRNYNEKPDEKKTPGYTPRSKFNKIPNVDNEILALRDGGMSVGKIAAQGFPLQCVKYLCYQKYPRHRKKLPPTHPGNGKMEDDQARTEMEAIMSAVTKAFKIVPEDFKNLHNIRIKAVRKAVCAVAYQRNIAPRIVAPYVGISPGGVSFNAHQQTQFANEEIAKLKLAYRG